MTSLIILITVSGKTVAWIAFAIMAIIFLASYIKRDSAYMDGELKKSNEQSPKVRNVLTFDIENITGADGVGTREEIELDVLKLSETDNRYRFSTSGVLGDYTMLIDYLKAYSLNVFSTRVNYRHDNWQGDVIYHVTSTPFMLNQKPILVGFDAFSKHQFQRNVIDSKDSYIFDYFNSLKVSLKPNEKKSISLLLTDDYCPSEPNPIKCALIIRNNSDVVERVKLFDNEYYVFDAKEKGKIEIQSVFKQVTYEEVLVSFETKPLIAKELKIFIGKRNKESSFKLNFDEYPIAGLIESGQFQNEVVDMELRDDSYIASFEIDVEPNSEIFISFK